MRLDAALHYLSPTEGGRQHDKKLADDYALHLPAGSVLRQNLGLLGHLGHAPTGVVAQVALQEAAEAGTDLFAADL